jgi:hypothetical protein
MATTVVGRLQSGSAPTTPSAAPLATPKVPVAGRLQSGKTTPTTNVAPKNGILSGLGQVANTVAQDSWGGIKNAWSAVTYWTSRPEKAVETTIAKAMGVPEASNLNPLKVLAGMTPGSSDVSGQDIFNQLAKDWGKDPNSWETRVGAGVGGFALDVATDPLMYVSGDGLFNRVGEMFDETGKSLGVISNEGMKAIKDMGEAADMGRDVTKYLPDVMEQFKDAVKARYLNGEDSLITERGLKFAGKTILSGDSIDKTISAVRDSAIADWVRDSTPYKVVQATFNPKVLNGVEMDGDYYRSKMQTFAKNSYAKVNGWLASIKFFDGDSAVHMTAQDASDFFRLANDTTAELGVSQEGLKGLGADGIAKIIKEVQPEVSENVAKQLAHYVDEWRPMMEGIKSETGLSDESMLKDYIRNVGYNSEEKVYTQSRPMKKLIAAFQKGRVSDEDFVRGMMKAAGQDADAIDQAIYNLKNPLFETGRDALHDVAMKARYAYGLSDDPYLSLATEHAETMARKNLFDHINYAISEFGKAIDPSEMKQYKEAGYGIYTPSSFFTSKNASEMYAFENKAIADDLNQIFTKTPDSGVMKSLKGVSGRLVNLYFFNPLTAIYHVTHNVMMNMWLAGGMNAFDTVTQGVEDARDGGAIIDRMQQAGALRPLFNDGRSMQELGTDMMQPQTKGIMGSVLGGNYGDAMRKLGDALNPFGNTNVGNKLFQGSDEAIRASIFRTALNKGATDSEAADYVNHIAGNWQNVSATEKSFFQALYPYYSWFKTNLDLQFGSWLTNPQRQLLPIKVWNSLNEALAGVPLWQNDQGAAWKIATGQKNQKGEMVYVTPAASTNLVPELIQEGAQGLLNKLGSGPIPEAGSILATGKDVYSNLYGITSPYADSGAPFTSRLLNLFQTEVQPQGTDVVGNTIAKGVPTELIKTLTGWDTTHPMWENIVQTFLQSYTAPVEQTWIQNYYQKSAYQKYLTDLKKYQKKQASE